MHVSYLVLSQALPTIRVLHEHCALLCVSTCIKSFISYIYIHTLDVTYMVKHIRLFLSLVQREPRNKTVYSCYVALFPSLPHFYLVFTIIHGAEDMYYCEHKQGRPGNEANCYVCIHYIILSGFIFMCTPHTHTHTLTHSLTLTPRHSHPHSGGTNYTVTGTDLDSVQQPRLLFYMDGAAGEGRTRRQTAGQTVNYIQSEVSMERGSCKPCIFL